MISVENSFFNIIPNDKNFDGIIPKEIPEVPKYPDNVSYSKSIDINDLSFKEIIDNNPHLSFRIIQNNGYYYLFGFDSNENLDYQLDEFIKAYDSYNEFYSNFRVEFVGKKDPFELDF